MYFPLAKTSLPRGEFSSPVLSRRKSSQESIVWGFSRRRLCMPENDFTLQTLRQWPDTSGLIWVSHLTRIKKCTQNCKQNWEIGQLASHLSGWANQTWYDPTFGVQKLTGLAEPRPLLGMTHFQRLPPLRAPTPWTSAWIWSQSWFAFPFLSPAARQQHA